MHMVKFYREMFDKVYSLEKKIIAIRHYNNSRINDEELENIRREKKNTKILYKNFGQESISNPYDPFLEWIKELCAENDIETDELLDRCNVYSMHKEVFSSYFNTGHASRNEKPLIDEIEYEEKLFTEEVIRLLKYLSDFEPVCIMLDNLSMAGDSTLVALKKLMDESVPSIAIICSYNENETEVEHTKELWNSIVEYWEDCDLLFDVLGEENEENNKLMSFRCTSDLLDKDYDALMNLYHFMCFNQVEHYLSIYYHKFEVEKLAVQLETKFNFLELYASVSMYTRKSAESLLYLNGMRKLLETLDDEEWLFKYHITATKIYMHSFQSDLATEHINACKHLSEKRNDPRMKFEIALLEHMVFFQGWRDHWLLTVTLTGVDELIDKCIEYGYDNHLAHIYVYAYENDAERFSNLDDLTTKMPHFFKGIKIAQKIGNYHFLIEAYRKNVLMASTHGYYHTANYFNEKIKDICIKYNDKEELANNYNGMGYNCCVMEEYQEANEHYNNALWMFMQGDNMEKINETVYNIAINCLLARDFEKADSLFQLTLKGIGLINANGINVCNISKIYGLRAFCNYMLGRYYNTMINLQYTEQFLGHIIDLEDQDVDAPHLWDDDLAILYSVTAAMHETDGHLDEAYKQLIKAKKYIDRAVGSRFMFLCPYAIIFTRIARKTGHEAEADIVLNEAKKYCKEKNYKKRLNQLEMFCEGKEAPKENLNLGISKVKTRDIIEKAKYTGMAKGYLAQKADLEFLSIWQKLLSENTQDADHVLDNAFVTLANKYNLDDFLFIRMENERPVMKYKICEKDIAEDTMWYIVDYFNERRTAFITSRFDKSFGKYQKFINRCFGFNSITTFIAVPIFTNERLDSIFLASVQMNMDWSYKSKKYKFDNNDLSVFNMLYHNVIDYIERADAQKMIQKANTRLQKMAVNDQLTSIYNRQGMNDIFSTDFEKIAIIYADLDNFKYYNDTFGHDIGDKVLVEFAKMLGQVTNQRSDAVRYGGDEFLLIMYTDDKNQVDTAVKNIYAHLEESKGLSLDVSKSIGYELDIPKDKQLSCSIGIALGSIDEKSDKKIQIQNILKKADTMMYRVKHSTKNSYMYYDY